MSTYRDRLRDINRHAGRAADSTWEYIGDPECGQSVLLSEGSWMKRERLKRELSDINANLGRRPIAPEVLAVKLEAATRGEFADMAEQLAANPKLPELLWTLQWWSFQPGGLETHVVNPLIAQGELGFPELHQTKPARKGRFTESQIRALLDVAPRDVLRALGLDSEFGTVADAAFFNQERLATPEAWLNAIRDEVRSTLPGYLHQLCQSPAVDFSGRQFQLIPNILRHLIDFMEAAAVREAGSIAVTETSRRIGREIEFAESQRGLVMIVGDSRIGKTVSAQARVRMRPGRRRYLEIPSTNDLASLYRAFARSLGVFAAPSVKPEALRCLVEYVFRVSGMAVIADEFHYCLPVQFTRSTKPRRLDWVRTALFDRGVPLVAITTPQDMESWRRFMRYTEYTQNQFRGRLDQQVFLSSEIAEEDVAAVANHLLRGCSQDAIDLVIARAIRCDMGLKVVDAIMRRAAWLAQEAGRTRISASDLDAAWKELEPSFQYEPLSAEGQACAEAARKAHAAPSQATCNPGLSQVSRGRRPAEAAPRARRSIIPEMAGA